MAISDLVTPGRGKHGPTCAVCQEIARLEEVNPTEADALQAILADPAWQYTRISEALRTEGIELAHFQIGNHVRGNCAARTRLR